ncbi:hypothetical protein [Pelomonas sp. KK5]|uniref:hypothetical protein n=1 Tax=Pelomonas sp. KK5 TaxID=1855730 RepID=UPI00117D8128|nr:hypothetical protein [Pelomonas sp. KK5]
MSKHQIFLVHGMGNFEAGWSEVIRKRLLDAFAQYPALKDGGFADAFEFKEILYNDTFEAWRKQWREDAQAAANALTAVGASSDAVQKLIEAAGAPGGGGFIATHVLDVVAFRFLTPIAQTVSRSVQAQILGHIKAFPVNDTPRYSIIAHSLGTSVVYETFHQMLTQVVDGGLLTPAFRPDNVFMVANTAKLLWNRGEGTAYPTVLSPDLIDNSGLCFRFCNFRHALDPVPAVDRFNPPDDWFAPSAPRSTVYRDDLIPAGDVQDINVHAFEHYLSHPIVHVPILRILTGFDKGVSKAEMDDAIEKWRAKTLSAQKLAKAKIDLTALAVKVATQAFGDEIAMLAAVRKLAVGSALRDGETP